MRKVLLGLLMAVAVAAYSPRANAEADVNAVAVFYSDGTYSLRGWDDLADLRKEFLDYVEIMVFHVQGGGLPNVVSLSGVDTVGLMRTQAGLLARRVNVPPFDAPLAQQRFFGDDGFQTGNIDMTLPPEFTGLAVAALDVMFFTRQWSDPTYDELEVRAGDLRQFLRSELVPSDGTY